MMTNQFETIGSIVLEIQMTEGKITRRSFIQAGAVAAGGAVLAACAPAATPTTVAPTAAPVEPTKMMEPTATTAAAMEPTATTAAMMLTAEDLLTKAGLPLPWRPQQPQGLEGVIPQRSGGSAL